MITQSNWVQAAVTSVSFPTTLERLRAMGTKWLEMLGRDWVTDMDVLLDFPDQSDIPWIAPKWLTAGDLLFFYHTKSAKIIIARLLATLKLGVGLEAADTERLRDILERASRLANKYSGSIFAFGEVSGRPKRLHDPNKHFKSTIYAPIGKVHVFDTPLRSEQFGDVLAIGQNTTTPMYGHQFEEIRERLSRSERLPKVLSNAKCGGQGFRDVNADNWPDISCHPDTRFIDETQIRIYLIDYLLREMADPRQPILVECECFRSGRRTGFADYFISMGGTWIPVEAKLNILAEEDVVTQVAKYMHIDSFVPTMLRHKGTQFMVNDSPFCLIVDQSGIYLVREGVFHRCSPDSPLYKRTEITHAAIPGIRNHILRALC